MNVGDTWTCPHGMHGWIDGRDPGPSCGCSSPNGSVAALNRGRPNGYTGNGQRPTVPRVQDDKTVNSDAVPVAVDQWRQEFLNCPSVSSSPVIAVGLTIATYAEWATGMECYPSQARLAAQLGFSSTRAVSNTLGVLRGLGWLSYRGKVTVDGANHGNDEYWLTVPEHAHPHDGSALRKVKT